MTRFDSKRPCRALRSTTYLRAPRRTPALCGIAATWTTALRAWLCSLSQRHRSAHADTAGGRRATLFSRPSRRRSILVSSLNSETSWRIRRRLGAASSLASQAPTSSWRRTNRISSSTSYNARPSWHPRHPTTLTAAQFFDKLNGKPLDPLNPGSGPALTPSQRDALVAQLSPDQPTYSMKTKVGLKATRSLAR